MDSDDDVTQDRWREGVRLKMAGRDLEEWINWEDRAAFSVLNTKEKSFPRTVPKSKSMVEEYYET